jgi:hypothetical protein
VRPLGTRPDTPAHRAGDLQKVAVGGHGGECRSRTAGDRPIGPESTASITTSVRGAAWGPRAGLVLGTAGGRWSPTRPHRHPTVTLRHFVTTPTVAIARSASTGATSARASRLSV